MSGYQLLWLLWGIAFFAIELPAFLNDRKGDTLSEQVWMLFSVRGKGTLWRVRRGLLALALMVLSYHFLAGGGWLVVD